MNGLNSTFIKKILSYGTFTFTINGNSMKPLLFPGDTVKIAALSMNTNYYGCDN
jgi:phage repressor protein C with HTH and peptisase S24 domain